MKVAVETEIYDPRLRDLILHSSDLTRVFSTMLWAEGPVYFPTGDYFLWSDIPNNRLYQWLTDDAIRVFSYNSANTNGNTRDPQGRLLSCRHLTRSVVRKEHDGTETILADRFDGKRLNSPNDLVVSTDGSVWFTDPTYGIMTDFEGQRAEPEQPCCRVYQIDKKGQIRSAIDVLQKPNGLAFSPGETQLYIADSARSHDEKGHHHLFACSHEKGNLSRPEPIFEIEHGVPDGLRVDEFGHIWCSSARGIEILDAKGVHLGCLKVPEPVSNLEFGGPKGNRLLITASRSVYSVYVAVAGAKFKKS
ncbi:MAG: SMP-30/gluconolactonase/LRE family protein [Cohaesibacter sp.]|nr:SMP-30/gluconolactonase/LRE family protein [Cohaesibacter sp.]